MEGNHHLYESLGAYIGKAGKVMEKRINHNFSQAGYDIRLEHWIVLVHLWIKDGQNQKTLCEIAGRHKTTITRTIDSLEEMNYVVRIPDQADKRHKLIYLTHKGKAEQGALIQQMQKTIQEATEGIPQTDIAVCKSVLGKIFLNLADEEFKYFLTN